MRTSKPSIQQGLRPKVFTQTALIRHFEWSDCKAISLRQLMDLAPAGPTEWPNLMMSSLLRVRGVGKKGFWCVVNGLTDMDLGTKGNREWQERLIKVKAHYQIPKAILCSAIAAPRIAVPPELENDRDAHGLLGVVSNH